MPSKEEIDRKLAVVLVQSLYLQVIICHARVQESMNIPKSKQTDILAEPDDKKWQLIVGQVRFTKSPSSYPISVNMHCGTRD
jgi:hypothetical protein